MIDQCDFPIDFVITWVDQSDSRWQQKYKNYKGIQGDEALRYRDYGTLKYVFRSIERYAPWVHHVFLVTDEQIPDWLNKKYKKITIIDHKKIIPLQYLPTFNSNVIDFHLKNIPGLAEHFVYFNDDTFLNGETKPEDFFTKDGFIRDNLAYNLLMPSSMPGDNFDHIYINNLQVINNDFIKYKIQKKQLNKIFNFKNGLWNLMSLLLFPFPRYSRFFDPHIPLSFRKSVIEDFLTDHPFIKEMFNNKTRENTDFSIWLVRYYELLKGNFYPRSIKFGKRYALDNIENVVRDIKKHDHKVICINDADVSNDKFRILTKKLRLTFQRELSVKSTFEK